MANTIIDLLRSKGYKNDGDNRSYIIKSLNTLLDSGFITLDILDCERAKTHSFKWEKAGKKYCTLYKVKVFGQNYYGHFMPKQKRTADVIGGGHSIEAITYDYIDLNEVLCKVASLISVNKYNFDFLKGEKCNCSKCNGTGHIPSFAHYAKGVCFKCAGTGIDNAVLRNYIKSNVELVGN